MRAEIIRCDACNKEHNATYKIPVDWIETRQRDNFDNEEEHHFCSESCLSLWSQDDKSLDCVDDCMKMLSISLDLLDPKGSLGGPAGIMEQMMIMENVKTDYAKLLDAIQSLRKRES